MSAISHLDDQQGLEVQLGQGVQRQEVLGVLGDLRFTTCKLGARDAWSYVTSS